MKILILGSGLLGVTTAYELGRRGFDVTVIDRRATSGEETSFANGGQLSYSHAEPWATPSVLLKLPKWLFNPDAPLVFQPRADWQMVRWGLSFLRNCTNARADANAATTLRLGLYSREKMTQLRAATNIAFDFEQRGILHLFGTEHDFDHAKKQNDFQTRLGGRQRILSRDECLALEPVLSQTSRPLVGGIHSFLDEAGDAYLYCNALEKFAAQHHNVKFEHNVTITGLKAENGRIVSVSTDKGDLTADGYVMALGSYSQLLLRPLGIDLPIYPMKGYSITVPANDAAPQVSLTDGTYKVVYSRLGSRLRVAGTAEFAGHDTSINERRIAPIVRAARSLLPGVNWDHIDSKWACLRPSTPDGPPIMGPTPIPNLFLNTGHGTLGWTHAAGSAAFVADLMERKTPEILMTGLTMDRYR